jgi:hypothetical protein
MKLTDNLTGRENRPEIMKMVRICALEETIKA